MGTAGVRADAQHLPGVGVGQAQAASSLRRQFVALMVGLFFLRQRSEPGLPVHSREQGTGGWGRLSLSPAAGVSGLGQPSLPWAGLLQGRTHGLLASHGAWAGQQGDGLSHGVSSRDSEHKNMSASLASMPWGTVT